MIINGQLSLLQQKEGRNKLLLFSFMNGIALTFITGNVLSLYLLKIGFSPSVVAILASLGYVGTLFAFTGKWFIAKLGASLTIRVSGLFSGIAAIFLSLIPFFYCKNFIAFSEIFLIIAVIFIFYTIRSIGTTAIAPLMGEFTDDDNKGQFTSKYFKLYNIATIIAILSLIFIYLGYKTIFIFQLVIFTGGILAVLCSFVFAKTKESSVPMKSARHIKTSNLLSLIWKTEQYRKLFILRSFARAGMIIIIPISIIALKTTYGVNDQSALIFACVQLLGGFFITYLYGIISDYTGSKPLIIINIILLSLICLFWIYTPHLLIWQYSAVIFFIGGACLFGLDSSLQHYCLTIIPKEESVGISLWMTTIGGVVAGIAGIVVSGGLIELYSILFISHHVFKFYYATMLVLLVPLLYFSSNLKSSRPDEWSTKKVFKLLFAPSKMYSLYSLRGQNKYSSHITELNFAEKLQGMSSDISEKHLIYYLESPDFFVKSSALIAMYNLKLKESSKLALYKFIKSPSHVSYLISSTILAKNNFNKALPLFRKRLSDTNTIIVLSSMMALAIMKDEISYSKIINIFKNTDIPHLVIYGSKAISEMNDKKHLNCLLEKLTHCFSLGYLDLVNEIVQAISIIISCDGIFYKYIRISLYDHNKGLLELIGYIDNNMALGLSDTPEKVLKYYDKDRNDSDRKLVFINYLKEALKRDIPEMKELKIFEDYFTKTEPNLICGRLMVCIFIKLFCKTKPDKNDIDNIPKLLDLSNNI